MATRRRGSELATAILDAAVEEVEENGYAGTTFEAVARRAETSKSVLYRRWPTKPEMVIAAMIHRGTRSVPLSDTGSLRGDMLAALRAVRTALTAIGREVTLGVLADVAAAPSASPLRQLGIVGLEFGDTLLERARERGEITDLPAARIRSLPFDLLRYEFLISGDLDDQTLTGIVDDVFLPLVVPHR
ncbi:TetR/AcrR family transcriptional regulator [Gordonia jinhuaensis]|uniref:TetR family transcriptional regulator n=1 Tax=Gordonia jinhuaensis TaxID=1517702 RepID=A0A916WWK4_9ACTN|nr:TetR/AcrR family transcriptional regulator [Gordonia jinhuaensis]GGB35509.1 TetR family transcriptional regulator [Gordonia jinhuaensis]